MKKINKNHNERFIINMNLISYRILPDMCKKHCVNAAIAKPDAKAVASKTEETLAPTPAPAADPHTMNT